MKTRMEAFATARFATHPDGRIAARIRSGSERPWDHLGASGLVYWFSDAAMASEGWSPLDETRPPRVVTDEGAARGVRALRTMFPESLSRLSSQGLNNLVRVAVNAALSAAPTTDAEKIARQNLGDAAVDRLGAHFGAAPATDEYYWQTAYKGAVFRREEAERERDEAIREAEELGKALDNVKPMDTLTAREHLDAAWEAAHVPADGTIPKGAEFIAHRMNGRYAFGVGTAINIQEVGSEYRLLDPPTPARPEGAEALQVAVEDYLRARLAMPVDEAEPLADFLAERGVRVTEDGTP